MVDISRSEFELFNKRAIKLDIVPEYIPTEEEIALLEENPERYLAYLFWLYTRYPRHVDEEESQGLERIRPLLKKIHVRADGPPRLK